MLFLAREKATFHTDNEMAWSMYRAFATHY